MDAGTGIRTVVWMDAGQSRLVSDIAARAGLRVIGVGMARGAPRGGVAGEALLSGAVAFDDIRHATATIDAQLLLLASVTVTGEGGPDAALLRQCAERGMRVATMLPVPWTTAENAAMERSAGVAGPDRAIFVPLLSRWRTMGNVRDAMVNLGAVRCMTLSGRCGTAEGSLGARLYDAMQFIHDVLGVPETIDAAVVTTSGSGGLHLAPADTLAGLHGDLTANLRFSSGRSAAVALSDRSGGWFRGGMMLGDNGCIRFDERGFEHADPSGAVVDESPPKPKPGARKKVVEPPCAASALAEQLAAMLDPRTPAPAPYNETEVLAMCEAAVLSARTGQGESPETIRRMAGAA